MDKIRGAFNGGKKGLGNWEALAQADPDLKIGADAMTTNMNMGMEMTTFASNQAKPAAAPAEGDLESGGVFSSLSSSFSRLTGRAQDQPEPEDNSTWGRISATIISYIPAAPELSYMQRLAGFALLFGAGALLLFYCVFMFPQIFLGGAAKFSMAYIMANIFLVSSSCFITSPTKQVAALFTEQRRWVSAAYFGSMIVTLWACLYVPSMFVVLPCLMFQIFSLVWYLFSYTPCGTSALNSVATSIISSSFSFGS
jgi:hypothetical protein